MVQTTLSVEPSDVRAVVRGIVKAREPMSMHTTYGIGGPADVYVEPADAEDLAALIAWANARGVVWMAMGGGANMLVSDKGIRGIVIKMGKPFTYIKINGDRVVAGAGAVLAKVITVSVDAGLSGLEGATAVHGTIGGAIVMNAGTPIGYVGSAVELVSVVTSEGERLDLTPEELQFAYRWSVFQADRTKVIVEVTFHLKPGDKPEIIRTMEHLRKRRSVTQPALGRSAGCMFKNPPGPLSAGSMIDQAGLKGARIGDAVVSDKHANFILNVGNATAKDVRVLADRVRDGVKDKFGVELQFEVRIVGDW